jgi:hypothetical protein
MPHGSQVARWVAALSVTAYCAYLACLSHSSLSRHGFVLAVVLICGALAGSLRFSFVRQIVVLLAAAHAAIAVLGFGEFMHELRVFRWANAKACPLTLQFVVANVGLPAAVFVLLQEYPKRLEFHDTGIAYLPGPTGVKAFSLVQRLCLVLGITVAVAVIFIGGPFGLLVLSIATIPIGYGLYVLLRLIRPRQELRPSGQRRIRVGSQRLRSSQTKSHWTVNSSPFTNIGEKNR